MKKAASFVLGAVLLLGAATLGLRSSSAVADEHQKSHWRTKHHRASHGHYRHRRSGHKRVPNAESLRKQSW
jgi:hypothetical protein